MKTVEGMRLWLEAVVNSSDDAIISKDLDNIIISWNKGAELLYGYKAEEVIGKHISIIIPEDKMDDVMQTAKIIENMEFIHHLETVRVTKDGRRLDVSVTVSPIINDKGELLGSSAIVRDITDKKKHEQSLIKSEDRYRKLVELSPDAIIITQSDKIVFINHAGVELLCADSAEQLIGSSIWSLYTPESHGVIRNHNYDLFASGGFIASLQYKVVRLDQKIINVEVSACAISYDNEDAIYTIMRDVTEQQRISNFLAMQYDINDTLFAAISLIEGLHDVLKAISRWLKSDVAKIWVYSQKTKSLHNLAAIHTSQVTIEEQEASKEQISCEDLDKLVVQVWTKQELVWLEDRHVKDEIILQIMFPIKNAKECNGVLELQYKDNFVRDEQFIKAANLMCNQISNFVYEHELLNNILYLNRHDIKTGLSNREFFEDTLEFKVNKAKGKRQRLALIMLDIDRLMQIAEAAGYEVVSYASKNLVEILLWLDIPSDNLACFTDHRFAIVVDDIGSADDVVSLTKNINQLMRDGVLENKVNFNLLCNFGVCMYPEDGDNVQELLKNVSVALSMANRIGHGALQFFDNDMRAMLKRKLILENDLSNALNKKEFSLYYQPLVDTNENCVVGMEALIRWYKNGTAVSPGEFIPLLEETHMIVMVGEWIMRQACAAAAAWRADFAQPVLVSVNISPIQFMHSDVVEMLKRVLQETGLDPSLLKVEITESLLINDVQRTIKLLQQIKDVGVKISIDDFGTGYSSLSYFSKFPIDYIKIDRSFIINLTTNPSDVAIVKTIITLADNLGYKVIAEGIETLAQLELLKSLGCHEIQGYYFAKPMPEQDVLAFLARSKKFL